MYRSNKRKGNNQGLDYFSWGSANSGRHHGWVQTSQSNISGTLPEVALKLVQETKKSSNGSLSIRLKDRNRTFTYSAKITGGIIEITDIQDFCGYKERERFEHNSAVCGNCNSDYYSRCGGIKTLLNFRDYMRSYSSSVTIKSPIIRADEISMENTDDPFLNRKLKEYEEKGWISKSH